MNREPKQLPVNPKYKDTFFRMLFREKEEPQHAVAESVLCGEAVSEHGKRGIHLFQKAGEAADTTFCGVLQWHREAARAAEAAPVRRLRQEGGGAGIRTGCDHVQYQSGL